MPVERPVSATYLIEQGLSDVFIDYLRRWPKIVRDTATAAE